MFPVMSYHITPYPSPVPCKALDSGPVYIIQKIGSIVLIVRPASAYLQLLSRSKPAKVVTIPPTDLTPRASNPLH